MRMSAETKNKLYGAIHQQVMGARIDTFKTNKTNDEIDTRIAQLEQQIYDAVLVTLNVRKTEQH